MPKVRIELLEGRSVEFKKRLMDGVHHALVSSLQIPEYDRTICLYELSPMHFEIPGNKSSDYTHIEITMFAGRTLETKKKLYQSICKNLWEGNQIAGNDVFIILLEVPMENWGIRGGIPASEVNLEFKVNI